VWQMPKKLPEEIIVYECDKLDDDTIVYAVAAKVDDIPEDVDGKLVGVYFLNKSYRFSVRRELKE
jgi:hypothetical protein